MTFKVAQYGCGPVGCAIVQLVSRKSDLELVGAIDLVNVGCDLGDIAGIDRRLGVVVSEDADTVLRKTKPDVILHAIGSVLNDVYTQLERAIKAGANVISTCEELTFPYKKYPSLAASIDSLAKEYGVTVLGTGVNPGFLMDTWPLAMTAVCQDVRHIRAVRIQDASRRRVPFQEKIGAGKTVEEFSKLVAVGTLRHVGLTESVAMIATGLRWELDDIKETIEPIIVDTEVKSDFITVKPGCVAGVRQGGYGLKNGKELISLDFQAYIGAKESYDAVYISGTPQIEVIIKDGTHGDIATAAIVVNSIPKVIASSPGLMTMKDLPMIHALPGTY